MADLSDAANALVTLIAGVLYPAGPAAPSLTSDVMLVYAGTPSPGPLASDLAAGKLHITVFPRPGDKVTSVTPDGAHWSEMTNNGASGTAMLELRRQTRVFQIAIWAGGFARRDAVAAVVDAGLAAVSRLTLADGSQAVMTYDSSAQVDEEQKAGIYRRDLFYAVNYPTTQTMTLFNVAQTVTDVTPKIDRTGIATVSITSQT